MPDYEITIVQKYQVNASGRTVDKAIQNAKGLIAKGINGKQLKPVDVYYKHKRIRKDA